MNHYHKTSPLPPKIQIQLAFWCKGCHRLNGVVYTFLNGTDVEVVKRFKPFINSPMPTVDLDAEGPATTEDDVPGLLES